MSQVGFGNRGAKGFDRRAPQSRAIHGDKPLKAS